MQAVEAVICELVECSIDQLMAVVVGLVYGPYAVLIVLVDSS